VVDSADISHSFDTFTAQPVTPGCICSDSRPQLTATPSDSTAFVSGHLNSRLAQSCCRPALRHTTTYNIQRRYPTLRTETNKRTSEQKGLSVWRHESDTLTHNLPHSAAAHSSSFNVDPSAAAAATSPPFQRCSLSSRSQSLSSNHRLAPNHTRILNAHSPPTESILCV
jgi:hypothetical protein